jgi:hypothetical protein
MIVIGTDTHKRTHALAAVDEGTGRIRGSREIKADEAGHLAALKWARGLDDERVWAIEDCRSVSRRLEEALIAAGERVVRVAPHRMGASVRSASRARAPIPSRTPGLALGAFRSRAMRTSGKLLKRSYHTLRELGEEALQPA